MVTFQAGDKDSKISPKDRRLIVAAMPFLFPPPVRDIVLTIKHLHSDGSSGWILNGPGFAHPHYVKIQCGSGNFGTEVAGQYAAMQRATWTKQMNHGFLHVLASESSENEI